MYCSVICYQRFVTDLPVCLWIMDPHRKAPKKNASHGDEVLPQDTTHLIQRPCYQRGSLCKDAAGNQTPLRPPDHPQKRRKLQWHGSVSRSSGLAKTILQGTVKEGKRPGRQRNRWKKTTSGNGQAWSSPSPWGQWRTEKMEETGYGIICGAPTILAVKRLMMMMMMMWLMRQIYV